MAALAPGAKPGRTGTRRRGAALPRPAAPRFDLTTYSARTEVPSSETRTDIEELSGVHGAGGFAGATPPRATARSLCSTWHGRTARGDHGKRKATINAACVGATRYALPFPLRAVTGGGAPTKCRWRRFRLRSCAWRSAARRSSSPSSRGCPAGKASRVKCTWSGVRCGGVVG